MGDRLVCADCGAEAVNGACPDETCRRGRRTGPLRSWLADRCLKLAERLDHRYSFRWISSFTYTYEDGQGIRFREDGRGASLWLIESEKRKAWDEADTDWAPLGWPDVLPWWRTDD